MTAFRSKRGTVGWPGPQVKAICKTAELLGIDLDIQHAQTGTIYLTGSIGDEEVKIRVADHGECYCTATISCDPTGFTARAAIEWLAAKVGQPVPVAISRGWKAAETRKVNRQAAHEADIADRRNRVLAMLASNPDVGQADDGMVCAKVAAGEPNRKARTRAAEQAIADAYKIVNAKG